MQAMPRYSKHDNFFEALFQKEYRGVVHAAGRIAGREVAEDLAQDAFAALYRSGPRNFDHARNWLYRTVLNRAISHCRSAQRRLHRDGKAMHALPVEDPSAVVEREQTRELVQRTLVRINARYACVIALRYGGMSYKEISNVMNVNINQVGTLLLRAEAAFKKEYDPATSLR